MGSFLQFKVFYTVHFSLCGRKRVIDNSGIAVALSRMDYGSRGGGKTHEREH